MTISRRIVWAALIGLGVGVASHAIAMDMANEIEAESAIRASSKAAARIAGIRTVPSVGVVNLNITGGPFEIERNYMDAGDFRMVAERYAAGVSRMRRALRNNRVTRDALADHGIDVNDVVGVRISSGGSLRLYVLR